MKITIRNRYHFALANRTVTVTRLTEEQPNPNDPLYWIKDGEYTATAYASELTRPFHLVWHQVSMYEWQAGGLGCLYVIFDMGGSYHAECQAHGVDRSLGYHMVIDAAKAACFKDWIND